jgi:hypothetical protein
LDISLGRVFINGRDGAVRTVDRAGDGTVCALNGSVHDIIGTSDSTIQNGIGTGGVSVGGGVVCAPDRTIDDIGRAGDGANDSLVIRHRRHLLVVDKKIMHRFS